MLAVGPPVSEDHRAARTWPIWTRLEVILTTPSIATGWSSLVHVIKQKVQPEAASL